MVTNYSFHENQLNEEKQMKGIAGSRGSFSHTNTMGVYRHIPQTKIRPWDEGSKRSEVWGVEGERHVRDISPCNLLSPHLTKCLYGVRTWLQVTKAKGLFLIKEWRHAAGL